MFDIMCKTCLTLCVKHVLLILTLDYTLWRSTRLKNSIKTQRKKLRLSQEELAIKASVTRQTINAIENDKYDPSLGLAFKLAYVLQTSIETLFIWKDDQND